MATSSLWPLVGAIDEGTSSARFILFKVGSSEVVCSHQMEIKQLTPQEGWVEQDPRAILNVVQVCITETIKKLEKMGGSKADIVSVGITNQRETTLVWDKDTGEPLYNAILWSDIRTKTTIENILNNVPSNSYVNFIKPICGLRLSTYFSAVKLAWLMDNVTDVKKAIDENRCLFGTVDTWLMWHLLGKHITDVTNASRTMLMNIHTLKWDEKLLTFFNIPKSILPEIRSSSEVYGEFKDGPLKGIRIAGCLGDQQSSLLGQRCINPGDAKATYGTGCFILYNIGNKVTQSNAGLLTTVAYQLGPDAPACYALEGSVAVAGHAIEWLRSNMNILDDVSQSHILAEMAPAEGGVIFVPAFSGLFAPYWNAEARGVICNVSEDTDSYHIVKAALEAVCLQVLDITTVMEKQCKFTMKSLKVDGGMTENHYFLELQANLAGYNIVKAGLSQSTALGAAMVAQWAVGFGGINENFVIDEGKTVMPTMSANLRATKHHEWKKALELCIGWGNVQEV